MHSDLPDIS